MRKAGLVPNEDFRVTKDFKVTETLFTRLRIYFIFAQPIQYFTSRSSLLQPLNLLSAPEVDHLSLGLDAAEASLAGTIPRRAMARCAAAANTQCYFYP